MYSPAGGLHGQSVCQHTRTLYMGPVHVQTQPVLLRLHGLISITSRAPGLTIMEQTDIVCKPSDCRWSGCFVVYERFSLGLYWVFLYYMHRCAFQTWVPVCKIVELLNVALIGFFRPGQPLFSLLIMIIDQFIALSVKEFLQLVSN